MFFAAVSGALAEKLATDKALRATINGFTAVVHTWTQRMEVHIYIHCLIPDAGLNARGKFVRVKNPNTWSSCPTSSVPVASIMYRLLRDHHWQVDPQVWSKDLPAGRQVGASTSNRQVPESLP